MIGFLFSDGGRAASGRRGKAGDCVTRALAIITGADYDSTYRWVAACCKDAGYPRSARNGVAHAVRDRIYLAAGLKKLRLPPGAKPTYSEAAEGCGGTCIVSTARHVAAIVNGHLCDTFDGRTYRIKLQNGTVETRERKAASVWVPTRGIFAADVRRHAKAIRDRRDQEIVERQSVAGYVAKVNGTQPPLRPHFGGLP